MADQRDGRDWAPRSGDAPAGERWTDTGYSPGSRVPPGAGGSSYDPQPPGELADLAYAPLGAWREAPPERRYTLAGWWSRAFAAVIDGVLIGILALVLLLPLGIGLAGVDSDAGVVALVAAVLVTLVMFAVVSLLYAPLMLWKTNGKTVGRMVVGIRLVRVSGEPMSLGTAVVREVVLKWLVFGAAGSATGGIATVVDYLWPLWDEEHRALHDFPVNTRTVRS